METYGAQFNTAIAAELRAQRARMSMTVDALVEKTGISKSAVLHYLNDQRQIPLPAFYEICSALGADPIALTQIASQQLEQD